MADCLSLCSQPQSLASDEQLEFCGQAFLDVRNAARQAVVELAVQHTRAYHSGQQAISCEDLVNRPLILSGHQPELFHPGVWYKNFLLDSLSRKTQAIAINFLVDNDLCRDPSIRVPSRAPHGDIHSRHVPFDSARTAIPWELRRLESEELWHSFPERVSEASGSIIDWQPLLHEIWPQTFAAVGSTGNIGLAIGQARHRLEIEEGLSTLEVPLSALVDTRAFARFSIFLLSELPRFQQIYNCHRDSYRRAHNIRNSAHPVPPLAEEDGWLEGPWWVYRHAAPTRQRLWIRMVNDQLVLSDRAGWQAVIEGRLDCDNAASQWMDLAADGVLLRPRALLTTMFLRMFVADLFVHGIGGGKYDQLTDGIISEFFGLEPPPFAVATATLHLPFAADDQPSAGELETQIRACKEQQWHHKYHAGDDLELLPREAEELGLRRKELLSQVPERGEKWQWHQEITAINRKLQDLTSDLVKPLDSKIGDLQSQLRVAQLLESREFSFCLFPRDEIVPALRSLAEG